MSAMMPFYNLCFASCFVENAALSLTLTLSRWEREQPLVDFVKSVTLQAVCRHRFAQTLGAFLPLRVGGADGERAGVRCAFHHLGVYEREERDIQLSAKFAAMPV